MKTDFLVGQSEIPNVGFIKLDGSFIDVEKYGVGGHNDFVEKIMITVSDDRYGNMLEFTEQGYIRFKNEGGLSVIQTATYPTRQQFSAIQRSVDILGKGVFEVFKNKVAVDYMRMTRDTLDADMRKLEALLNKVNPPQPKK